MQLGGQILFQHALLYNFSVDVHGRYDSSGCSGCVASWLLAVNHV